MWHSPRVSIALQTLKRPPVRNLGVAAAIAALHVGVFLVIARTQPSPPPMLPPVIEAVLFRPPPPEPPPPPAEPAPEAGGGAPAAASRIHTPPPRPEARPELPAPPVQAPAPDLTVGIAPAPSPTPGFGQGGEGTGTGSGEGEGSGPGSGMPFMIVRGPSLAEVRREHPRAALAARQSGRAEMSCEIRLDQRLENCRLLRETPPGMGFGEAALRSAGYFRVRPPVRDGQPVAGQRGVFGVEFGPPRR